MALGVSLDTTLELFNGGGGPSGKFLVGGTVIDSTGIAF